MKFSIFNNKQDRYAKVFDLDWHELTDQFQVPDIRDSKDGQLICAAIFNNNLRSKNNAIESSLLILDYDHDTFINLDIWNALNVSYAFYTTYSHGTIDKPCAYRVILPLTKPIPAKQYQFLYEWACDYSQGIDTQCKDVSRFMYLPACPPDKVDNFKSGCVTDKSFLEWETLIIPYQTQYEIEQFKVQSKLQERKNAKRKDQNYDRYIEVVLKNIQQELSNLTKGTRNNGLNKIAFTLGQLAASDWTGLTYNGVESFLALHTAHLGLSDSEIRTTIKSGLTAGFKSSIPPPLGKDNITNKVDISESFDSVLEGKNKIKNIKEDTIFIGISSSPIEPFYNFVHFSIGTKFEAIQLILNEYPHKNVIFVVPFKESRYHKKLVTSICEFNYSLCLNPPSTTDKNFKEIVCRNALKGLTLKLALADKFKNI